MNKKELQKVDKFKYKEKRKFFEMSGKQLKEIAKGSDMTASTAAEKELKRRDQRRKKKSKKV